MLQNQETYKGNRNVYTFLFREAGASKFHADIAPLTMTQRLLYTNVNYISEESTGGDLNFSVEVGIWGANNNLPESRLQTSLSNLFVINFDGPVDTDQIGEIVTSKYSGLTLEQMASLNSNFNDDLEGMKDRGYLPMLRGRIVVGGNPGANSVGLVGVIGYSNVN